MTAKTGPVPAESCPSERERGETEAQRLDRNLSELIQELRLGGLGVQVLFGFLLSLPFTTRFHTLSDPQRDLWVATLSLAALATALLSAPVAYHRLAFRRHVKEHLVRTANKMAVGGLAAVAMAVTGAVLLVTSFVVHGIVGPILAGVTALVFTFFWFVLPLARRDRPDRY